MAAPFIVSSALLGLGKILTEQDIAPTIWAVLLCVFYLPSVWAAAHIAASPTFKRKALWIALVLLLPLPGQILWHSANARRARRKG